MVCYINFNIDGRDLIINEDNPEDVKIWQTHYGRHKMKNPRWNQIKVQTNPKGYKYINIGPKKYKLHRINYYAHNQDWDIHDSSPNNYIDHEDDKGDLPKHQYNNIENLRVVTQQENCFNTKAKGYYYCKRYKKWVAQIRVSGKLKHLGYFDLEEDAKNSRLAAKKIYHTIQIRK